MLRFHQTFSSLFVERSPNLQICDKMRIENNSRITQHLRVAASSDVNSLCSPVTICIEKRHLSSMKSICTYLKIAMIGVRIMLCIHCAAKHTYLSSKARIQAAYAYNDGQCKSLYIKSLVVFGFTFHLDANLVQEAQLGASKLHHLRQR